MKKLSLIGSGRMAEEYIKVLKFIGTDFNVVSTNNDQIEYLKSTYNVDAYCCDVIDFKSLSQEFVINCVDIPSLFKINLFLLNHGVENILSEKPVAFDSAEIEKLTSFKNSNFILALNRRFYPSSQEALKILLSDGGARTCAFQFNERTIDWDHPYSSKGRIENSKPLHSQSIHLIDLVFHLVGFPKEFTSLMRGNNFRDYFFSGSGTTDSNCLFSFTSDWSAPGSWAIEITSKNYRLKFEPLEELIVYNYSASEKSAIMSGMSNHSISTIRPKLNDENCVSKRFKPGLLSQTEKFIKQDFERHGSLSEYAKVLNFINSFSANSH
jgi:predicted dehydrogenase